MRKRPPQAKLQRIDEILARALKKRQVPFHVEDRRLRQIWERAVGQQVAAQSRPESIKRDILVVRVSSSVWMQQLHFLKEQIIRKFNALAENASIKDIRFSIGQLPSVVNAGETAAPSLPAGLLKERDKKMMEKCLASLADQELKEIIRRVMTREIARRRFRERKAP